MPEFDTMFTQRGFRFLTNAELDAVAGGDATVSFTVSGSAAGPTNATISASATGTTLTIGGLSPANKASLFGGLKIFSF